MATYKVVATIVAHVDASDEAEAEEMGLEHLCWSNADIEIEEEISCLVEEDDGGICCSCFF